MNKSALKEVFTNAKAVGARYIGVKVKAAGSSQPEIIINPKENFDEKLKYYMLSLIHISEPTRLID